MSKRSTPCLRSCNEIKKDTQRNYEAMEKKLGKIHPVVLQKPYSACKPIKKGAVKGE